MKKLVHALLLYTGLCICSTESIQAQAHELQQLILNIQKLNQFRATLAQLKEGYEILEGGYNRIKNIAEGNFQLHKLFLDGLLAVSPTVRNYEKVAQIITLQIELVKTTRSSLQGFRVSQLFSDKELAYIEQVFAGLVEGSLKNLDGLLLVVTANQLRMNTAERLEAIDRLHASMTDQVRFSRYFTQKAGLLGQQRSKDLYQLEVLKNLTEK